MSVTTLKFWLGNGIQTRYMGAALNEAPVFRDSSVGRAFDC